MQDWLQTRTCLTIQPFLFQIFHLFEFCIESSGWKFWKECPKIIHFSTSWSLYKWTKKLGHLECKSLVCQEDQDRHFRFTFEVDLTLSFLFYSLTMFLRWNNPCETIIQILVLLFYFLCIVYFRTRIINLQQATRKNIQPASLVVSLHFDATV